MITIYSDVPYKIYFGDMIICTAIARYDVQTKRFHIAVVNNQDGTKKDIDGRMLKLISTFDDKNRLVLAWIVRDWQGNILDTYKYREVYHVMLNVDDVNKSCDLQIN